MSELNFTDLIEPVVVNQNTALRITVLGGGSFGTAMANTAVRNGCDTMIWIRDPEVAEDINATHINKRWKKICLLCPIWRRLFVIAILF